MHEHRDDRRRTRRTGGAEEARDHPLTGMRRLQRQAGNTAVNELLARDGRTVVQRAGDEQETGTAAERAGDIEDVVDAPVDAPARDAWQRLSTAITGNADERRTMVVRLSLDRRVKTGPLFTRETLADIGTLSGTSPKLLRQIGVERTARARALQQVRDRSTWLKIPPGGRLHIASIRVREVLRTGSATPEQQKDPAYTLGRFLALRSPDIPQATRELLRDERDTHIRETAVDTLDPQNAAGYSPETAAEHREDWAKDRNARRILTNVMILLQHGLQIFREYTAEEMRAKGEKAGRGEHVPYTEGDVVRALAHGGRVSIRIPALGGARTGRELLEFLGVTKDGERPAGVDTRLFSTHHMSREKNVGDDPGRFQEKGGGIGPVQNIVGDTEQFGVNFSAGGFATQNWNGDVVLPNGSHGHMLLVFDPPEPDKDGSLMVGLETTKMGADSPVGYKHGPTSSEKTANPESPFHGHKPDKIGGGEQKDNQRVVNLRQVGGAEDWLTYLTRVRKQWDTLLERDGTNRRELYRQLVGRRAEFPPPAPADDVA